MCDKSLRRCARRKLPDRAELLRPLVGKWVILSGDESRVLAYGRTLRAAIRRVKGCRPEDTVVTRVPSAGIVMLG
jgi:hypothetical protein